MKIHYQNISYRDTQIDDDKYLLLPVILKVIGTLADMPNRDSIRRNLCAQNIY